MESSSSREGGQPANFRGVRKRKWGKWVSEIREPRKKTRLWLGSFETPKMAATAYDVAALHLRGRAARLNFPEFADTLPRPMSSDPDHIRSAVMEAASRVREQTNGASSSDPCPVATGGAPASPSPLEFDDDSLLDSPKMWRDLAEALLVAPPQFHPSEVSNEDSDYAEEDSLWN